MKPNKRRAIARRSNQGLWKEYGDLFIALVTLSLMVGGVVKLRSAGTDKNPSGPTPPEKTADNR